MGKWSVKAAADPGCVTGTESWRAQQLGHFTRDTHTHTHTHSCNHQSINHYTSSVFCVIWFLPVFECLSVSRLYVCVWGEVAAFTCACTPSTEAVLRTLLPALPMVSLRMKNKTKMLPFKHKWLFYFISVRRKVCIIKMLTFTAAWTEHSQIL